MLTCQAGELNTAATEFGKPDSVAFQAGIINASQQSSTYCNNAAFTDENNCTQYLNVDKIKNDIASHNG
jgi:hypothetical protein